MSADPVRDAWVEVLGRVRDALAALGPFARIGVALLGSDAVVRAAAGDALLPDRLVLEGCAADPGAGRVAAGSEAGACALVAMPDGDGPAVFCLGLDPAPEAPELIRFARLGAALCGQWAALALKSRAFEKMVSEQAAIINHISDGLIVIDDVGTLRFMNAPAARILGVDAGSSIGKPFSEVIDFDPHITAILETGTGYVDRELRIQSSKVNAHLVDTAVPVFDEHGKIVSIVNTFHEMSRARNLSIRIAGDFARYRFADIVGRSPAMETTLATARRVAASESSVLLYGESGTGKEVFAQAIHNGSRRSRGPFVAVNCAALPRDLIESELFGYMPGSFTGAHKAGRPGRFELATGGTIFLDEISEIPLDVQVKLLRVLQERQVTRIGADASADIDVRIIAASNRNLLDLVEDRRFREDLYYRLNVLRLDLPPLRQRLEDIALLAEGMVSRLCRQWNRPGVTLASHAMAQLRSYHWPGNVRQLQNLIERGISLIEADVIEAFPDDWFDGSAPVADTAPEAGPSMSLEAVERMAIGRAVGHCDFNVSQAAKVLGISRPTLYKKMKQYGLLPADRGRPY
ncbi:MAG: sigma 54-interacting transcriptional regulator [Castellaniella sp.]|uniref:sigma-54 interaction domain-containing protein n=1 Tax=Castellaniella sp. TaxID=1955812 RepID=UPI003C7207DC